MRHKKIYIGQSTNHTALAFDRRIRRLSSEAVRNSHEREKKRPVLIIKVKILEDDETFYVFSTKLSIGRYTSDITHVSRDKSEMLLLFETASNSQTYVINNKNLISSFILNRHFPFV